MNASDDSGDASGDGGDAPDDGRVVVLTGANQGIGYHMLRALVDDGYRVACLDVDGENVASVRERYPAQVRYVECDVADADAVERAVAAVVDEWGRLDVLVNNAAVAEFGAFEASDEDAVRREFDVNYFGYRNTIRAVLPRMRAQGGGVVHNVSSGTALGGHPGLTGYASTKGAIEAFTRSLRTELHGEDVTCTLMQPPTTATRMTDRLGYPDWFANDPADVGRKLAAKVESTDPVVYADLQTRVGLAAIRRFPALWRWATARVVDLDSGDVPPTDGDGHLVADDSDHSTADDSDHSTAGDDDARRETGTGDGAG